MAKKHEENLTGTTKAYKPDGSLASDSKKNMKKYETWKFKNFFFFLLLILTNTFFVFAEDKIEIVPLINLEELSPTFEEDKDELEKIEEKNITLNKSDDISSES